MFCPVLWNFKASVALVYHFLMHSLYFVAEHHGILSAVGVVVPLRFEVSEHHGAVCLLYGNTL